jgi:mannose-6-phosphate isomerase-like protein (cupin superfamily)
MAPEVPEVQVDNDGVRVTRWTLARGETTGLHRHEHDYVVVPLADAQMRITAADGSVTTSDLRGGAAYFREAGVEHSVANERDQPVDFVEVELRARRDAPGGSRIHEGGPV